jgi:hypothetical protein
MYVYTKEVIKISGVVGVTLNAQTVCCVAVMRPSALHKAKRQSDLLHSCASVNGQISGFVQPRGTASRTEYGLQAVGDH